MRKRIPLNANSTFASFYNSTLGKRIFSFIIFFFFFFLLLWDWELSSHNLKQEKEKEKQRERERDYNPLAKFRMQMSRLARFNQKASYLP